MQGHGLPLPQELRPYQSFFFQASCSWQSEGLFAQSFSVALPVQALKRASLSGILLCSVRQAFDGPASLLFSCQCWRVGREAMVLAPPPTHDSAVSPCFHGCMAFLHRHFPSQSPPSHPLHLSLHSQQQPLPWDCSTIPKHQFPAAAASRGPASLSGVGMAAARTVFFHSI